mgnify:CR=1 FL=1
MRRNARQIPDSLVINYSSKPLTDGQKSLLQKHQSFCSLPDKLNKTQLTYDLARFGRTLRWKEVFKDEKSPETETIIPQKKHNLPKNAPSSTLSKFLYLDSEGIASIDWLSLNIPPLMSPGRGEGEHRGTLRTRQEKEKLNYRDTREKLPEK